jgi:hypothetical protein
LALDVVGVKLLLIPRSNVTHHQRRAVR